MKHRQNPDKKKNIEPNLTKKHIFCRRVCNETSPNQKECQRLDNCELIVVEWLRICILTWKGERIAILLVATTAT